MPRSHIFEIDRAAADQAEPLAALARQCYPDMAVAIEEVANAWQVRLTPLAPMAAAYDRGLSANLAKDGISVDDIMDWHRMKRCGRTIWLESIMAAWALVAWLHWVAEGGTEPPLILLVGGQGSLKVPLLVCEADSIAFRGLMENELLSLDRPESMARAVGRGLIDSSSFIAPFLRAFPAHIVHLTSDAAGAGDSTRFAVHAARWPHDPAVNWLVCSPAEDGPCSYRKITGLAALAGFHHEGQPVFVHFDLSFFDMIPDRASPASMAIRGSSADAVVSHLATLSADISAVTISYALGQCPSGRWAELTGEIRAALQPLLVDPRA